MEESTTPFTSEFAGRGGVHYSSGKRLGNQMPEKKWSEYSMHIGQVPKTMIHPIPVEFSTEPATVT